MGIDEVGIDEVGIDKVGIDEVGRYFWTNPFVVVGEAPSLSQILYKAYSYLPWAMIMRSCVHDTIWCLSRFVTCMHMTPIDVCRIQSLSSHHQLTSLWVHGLHY